MRHGSVDGICGCVRSEMEMGRYYITLYGDEALDAQSHSGLFTIRYRNIQFSRAPLSDGIPRRGCLRRGGKETFTLPAAFGSDRTSLGLAEVVPYWVSSGDNHISTLTVYEGARRRQTARSKPGWSLATLSLIRLEHHHLRPMPPTPPHHLPMYHALANTMCVSRTRCFVLPCPPAM